MCCDVLAAVGWCVWSQDIGEPQTTRGSPSKRAGERAELLSISSRRPPLFLLPSWALQASPPLFASGSQLLRVCPGSFCSSAAENCPEEAAASDGKRHPQPFRTFLFTISAIQFDFFLAILIL